MRSALLAFVAFACVTVGSAAAFAFLDESAEAAARGVPRAWLDIGAGAGFALILVGAALALLAARVRPAVLTPEASRRAPLSREVTP